jgi:hypothetical protein
VATDANLEAIEADLLSLGDDDEGRTAGDRQRGIVRPCRDRPSG